MDAYDYWQKLKRKLEKNIDIVIEKGNVDTETLVIMKELLMHVKVRDRDGGIIVNG